MSEIVRGKPISYYIKYLTGCNKYSYIRLLARQVTSKREQKCEKCGYDKHVEASHIKPIHQFDITESIDVVNHNNNLTLLCPNCHWETEYLEKKIEREKKLICSCGSKKCENSKRCCKCENESRRIHPLNKKVENRPNKQELATLTASNSMAKIGEMFGVSDPAIRKWCKQYGLESRKRKIK